MTDPNYTAVAFVVDRSGSMESIRYDAQGAINAFIQDQAAVPGMCTIRLSQFDTEYDVVHGSLPVADVPAYHLTPRGGTALLDAIGRTIAEFGEELAAMPEEKRPGKVIVVVQTDGQENSSKDWRIAEINTLIQVQRSTYNWDFLFLGANQDAIATGAALGVSAGSSLSYGATSQGVRNATASASAYVTAYRTTGNAQFSQDDRDAAIQ